MTHLIPMTYPKDIEMILTNAAQTLGIDPDNSGFVSDCSNIAKDCLPRSAVFILAFDSFENARAVASEARRSSDQRRKLLSHVCTGQGEFRGLYIATLI